MAIALLEPFVLLLTEPVQLVVVQGILEICAIKVIIGPKYAYRLPFLFIKTRVFTDVWPVQNHTNRRCDI